MYKLLSCALDERLEWIWRNSVGLSHPPFPSRPLHRRAKEVFNLYEASPLGADLPRTFGSSDAEPAASPSAVAPPPSSMLTPPLPGAAGTGCGCGDCDAGIASTTNRPRAKHRIGWAPRVGVPEYPSHGAPAPAVVRLWPAGGNSGVAEQRPWTSSVLTCSASDGVTTSAAPPLQIVGVGEAPYKAEVGAAVAASGIPPAAEGAGAANDLAPTAVVDCGLGRLGTSDELR